MKVCGFSFIRNGVKFDYPFEEAIRSILPICDQFIIAIGNSEDETVARINAIDPKIKIIHTVWDDSLKEGGRVLAAETDKAFQAIPAEYDWAFYIQGDEVLHEKYLPVVYQEMKKYLNAPRVEGLLFKYLHFFGSYDFVGMQHSWYRREIRVIRNNKKIFSYKDAQGFRKEPNEKLRVKLIDAYIYHYGYVREPKALKEKVVTMAKLYHDRSLELESSLQYEYDKMKEPLRQFTDSHPQVMIERIRRKNWPFNPDLSLKYSSLKDKIKRGIGKLTGWYPGEYKNYKII